MQIKRFEAKNMTDALRQIKRALGPEAVILSAKDLRRENRLLGISRKIGVEVTAAVDEDYPEALFDRSLAEKRVSDSKAHSVTVDGTAAKLARQGMAHQRDHIARFKTLAARAVQHYQNHDVMRRSSANEDVVGHEGAEKELRPAHQANDLSMGRYLAKNGLTVGAVRLNQDGPTLISLVGNAGVGKTATLAKLAATFTYTQKKSVGLLSLDRHRIGGHEQLQCYADSMQLPLVLPHTEDDMPQALERLQHCRIILIDTPAVHPYDNQRMTVLQDQFQRLGSVQSLLVVSAENREDDLNETLHRYAVLTPVGTIITKTDLTRSYTDLVNFLCRHGLAVYYHSAGPRVPFDLKQATIENLAARFLPPEAGNTFDSAEDRHPMNAGVIGDERPSEIYLANKNSDIFHRPECKWIRLINRANIVEFGSFAEALNHRFKPCRYCNPQHLSITGILSRERAAL
jgi:flagellar biosynthesis protein FlhF